MTMRVGMIGTGWVTEKHLASFAHITEGKVVAVAGRNEARAKLLAERHAIQPYADAFEMVDREKPDAVWISLAPGAHAQREQRLAGLVAGVMVEKPVHRDLAAACALRDTFQRNGTVAAAGYMNRYNPAVAKVRELFAADGEKPVMACGHWVGGIPGPAWWRRQAESGGQYVEQLTHVIDLARWLVGEVESVQAFSARGFVNDLDDYDIADATVSSLKFVSGAVGSFTTGCFSRKDGVVDGIGMEVASRARAVAFSGWDFAARMTWNGAAAALPAHDVPTSTGGIFAEQNRAFLQAVAARDPSAPRSTYADAVETLRVTLAVLHAADRGGPVAVREVI